MYKETKRAERRYNDYTKAKKQLNFLKNYELVPENVILGKYKKQHSLNCGRAGCLSCCNPRRTFGHITLKEEIANINYKENLKET
jgi:hypothetical protein